MSSARRGEPCAAFSRSRRNTFSTSTTASSTSSPIAIANPPSVIVLTPMPIRRNATTAREQRDRNRDERDHGGAGAPEKEKQHDRHHQARFDERAAHIAERDRDEIRLPEDTRSTADAGRHRALQLGERRRDRVASAASVSAPGCFCTDRMTASRPSTPALPRAGLRRNADAGDLAQQDRRAVADRDHGVAPSDASRHRGASARITNSASPWSTAPPPALAPTRASARSISAADDVEPRHQGRVGRDCGTA